MSYVGVSQTHWDKWRNEPDEVKLHTASKQGDPQLVGFDEGRAATPQDIADLLRRGTEVWTIVPDDKNYYVPVNRVSARGSAKPSLYSYDAGGQPTNSLADLPRWD